MAHPEAAMPVPYTSRLVQPLQAGQTLTVHGRVNESAKRFEVNLLAGTPEISTSVGNTALDVSVRFDEGKIVMNSVVTGSWGKEERVSNPFKVGQEFDLRIRAHDDKFEISANNKEIHEFKSRSPLSAIDFFQVKGDVVLTGVHWGGRYYTLPFETAFPHGSLRAGGRVFLYGIPPKSGRFEIDFLGRNGDVLFHYNPRFSEKVVVRNACLNNTWGTEEREGKFTFKKDIGFNLAFFNERFSIQIFLDGERVGTFAHRTGNPDGDYVGLRVAGDLELTGVEFAHQ